MQRALNTPGQVSLLATLRELEGCKAAALGRSGNTGALNRAEAAVSQHTEQVLDLARQHIRSCFPSFWGPIGSSRAKVRRKFGTFFRELNLYHFAGPQIGKIVYDDKLIFDAAISSIGFDSPRTVWMVNRTHALRLRDKKRRAIGDVIGEIATGPYFAKPRMGDGGKGAFLIRGNEVTYSDGSVTPACRSALAEVFASSPQNYLLQEVASQDKALSELNPTSLNTIRCLTYLDRHGNAQVMGATLRLGAGTMVVDNAASGGLYCGVDIDRGCILGDAVNKGGDKFARHPNTGVLFADYPVPNLEQVFEMCSRCHEAIGQPMTVGWDVAVSPDGPLLLEGNTRWTAKLHTDVDPGVATRVWSAYLGDWAHLDVGFARAGFVPPPGMRDKRLTVSLKVEGKVQRVGYRKWVARQAAERALAGHVNNRDDGSVAVRLSGPARRVEAMFLLVATGPRKARVSSVTVEDVALSSEADFTIRT